MKLAVATIVSVEKGL